MELPPRQALGLALAFHELTTNAVKHGALSNGEGRIDLRWSSEAERLMIEWRESEGPKVTPPTRRGFGSRLLERSLTLDLDAQVRLDFAPAGVVCAIDAALPRESRAGDPA